MVQRAVYCPKSRLLRSNPGYLFYRFCIIAVEHLLTSCRMVNCFAHSLVHPNLYASGQVQNTWPMSTPQKTMKVAAAKRRHFCWSSLDVKRMKEISIAKRADLKICHWQRRNQYISGQTRQWDKMLWISGNNRLSWKMSYAERTIWFQIHVHTCIRKLAKNGNHLTQESK